MSPNAQAATVPRAPRPRLSRPRSCLATGVSAGLARHLGWPVGIVRAAFIALTLLSGMGILLYLWLWAFLPFDPATGDAEADTITRRAPVAWGLVAASAIAAGAAIVLVAV